MVALDSVVLKLWGLEAEGSAESEDLKRSIAHLSSQELRSKTDEAVCHQAVIEGLKLCDPLAEGVEGIEYINEAEVCLEEFNERFIAHSKPCMIRGACEGWKAVEKWACAQDLVRTHGDMQIRITEYKDHPSAMAKPLRVPLRNFCSYVVGDSGGAEFPWYGFEDDFGGERQALLEDYEVPRYFREDCYDVSPEARHLFPRNRFFIIGGARTGTLLHIDPNSTCAWNSLLCGTKRWILFPPGSDKEYLELLGVKEEYSRKVAKPCGWWSDHYRTVLEAVRVGETFGEKKLRVMECVQRQGETIFVPAGWWHAVLNLDVTIAITANHLVPASLPVVWGELKAAWPNAFLADFAKSCAAKWPNHAADLNLEADGKAEASASAEDLERELSALATGAQEGLGGVLFLDADGVLKETDGRLRARSVSGLQALVRATQARIVLTSASRGAEVSRQALRESLNRWGLDFTSWITTADLAGGRASQILDYVSRNKVTENWAVIDSEGMGQQEGGLMMMQLLHSRCVVVDRNVGLQRKEAFATAEILLGIDTDDEVNE